MQTQLRVRRLEPRDLEPVLELLDRAFSPSCAESNLVRCLARSGAPLLAWVCERDRQRLGTVVYTPAYHATRTIGWHLAPIAVAPEVQRQGIGSELIRHSLSHPQLAASPVFVLGDPRYYRRFGFAPCPKVTCPFDPGGGHFLALRQELAPDHSFIVGYEPAFETVTGETDSRGG